jgi:hypothetical protein
MRHICEFSKECQMMDSMQFSLDILMADKCDCHGLVDLAHSQQIAICLIGEHAGLHNLVTSLIYMFLLEWEQVPLRVFA